MDIFSYEFFRNALVGSLLACMVCGIIGTYIVTRRLVFIAGGVTHSSFGGVGLGMYLGVNPVISAFLFAVATAVGVQWLGWRRRVREDSAIAMFWILGMSLGVIFCFLSPGYSAELSTYLFGSILTVTHEDITLLAVVLAVLLLFTVMFYRVILLVAFDREFAVSRGVPVKSIELAMMVFTAVAVVATLRLVGVMMAISMLTVPQMTAMLFTNNYRRIMLCSVLFGYLAALAGLLLSYRVDIPSGATIILCSVAIYAVCALAKRCVRHNKTHISEL